MSHRIVNMRLWCNSSRWKTKSIIQHEMWKGLHKKYMFMYTWINLITSVTTVMTYDTIGHLFGTQNGNHTMNEWMNGWATKNTEYKLKIIWNRDTISKYIYCMSVSVCVTSHQMWNKCNFNAIWFCVCLFGRPSLPSVSCPSSSRAPFEILSGIFSVSTATHVIRK